MPWSNWKHMWHNFQAHTREPASRNYWACILQPLKPVNVECSAAGKATAGRSPMMTSSPGSGQLEKACAQQWRPTAAKKKKNDKWINKLLENKNKKNLKLRVICARNFSAGKAVRRLQLPVPLPPSLPTSFPLLEGPWELAFHSTTARPSFIHSFCK